MDVVQARVAALVWEKILVVTDKKATNKYGFCRLGNCKAYHVSQSDYLAGNAGPMSGAPFELHMDHTQSQQQQELTLLADLQAGHVCKPTF